MKQIAVANGEIKFARQVYLPKAEWDYLKSEAKVISRILSKKVTMSQLIWLKLFCSDQYTEVKIKSLIKGVESNGHNDRLCRKIND